MAQKRESEEASSSEDDLYPQMKRPRSTGLHKMKRFHSKADQFMHFTATENKIESGGCVFMFVCV